MNDNMVWAVNAPVPHNPKLARKQTWANSGGQTGIVGPASLEVRAQEVPNNTVQVLPGGFVMAATPGGSVGYTTAQRQSYAGDLEQTRAVEIAPTGSSGPRTDVLGIVINDPEFEGTLDQMSPEQLADHKFWDFHVIQNYTGSTLTARSYGQPRPFLPLARVDVPANTGAIKSEMLTDLRRVAVAQSAVRKLSYPVSANRTLTSGGTHIVEVVRDVPIPEWATHAVISGWMTGAGIVEGSGSGSTVSLIGDAMPRILVGDGNFESNVFNLDHVRVFYSGVARWTRVSVPFSGNWVVPEMRRGQSLRYALRLVLEAGHDNLVLLESSTRFDVDIFFTEEPVSSAGS